MPPEDDAEDLGHVANRTVETTGYQLAEMVFADDGGQKYRRLLRSLGRLASARILLQLVEHDPELAAQRITSGSVALVGDIWMATIRLDLRTPREWGALKGSTSLKVEIGHWTAQQSPPRASTAHPAFRCCSLARVCSLASSSASAISVIAHESSK